MSKAVRHFGVRCYFDTPPDLTQPQCYPKVEVWTEHGTLRRERVAPSCAIKKIAPKEYVMIDYRVVDLQKDERYQIELNGSDGYSMSDGSRRIWIPWNQHVPIN